MREDSNTGLEDNSAALAAARKLDWFDPVLRERTEFDVYATVRGLPPQRSEATGEWYFLGYDDCREAFQRAELLSNDWIMGGDNPLGQSAVYPENCDGAEQREFRRVLDPMFSPQLMEKLESDMREYATELLERITAKPSCEFVAEFTMPFPTIIFCRLMGFPLEDHPRLMRWKDVYMNSMTPFIASQLGIDVDDAGRPSMEMVRELTGTSAAEIIEYLGSILDERRRVPQDDVITKLVNVRHTNGDALNDDELIRICFNLFLGGLDTVTGMLSMIIRDFAENADHRARFVELMDDPDRVGPAVEELVRFHSIVSIPRRVTEDCVFRGAELRKNDIIQVVTPAADRDPGRFPGADGVDYDRSPNPHLGFGLGIHRCLGIHLARRELRIGLQEIHRLMPHYSLDPAAPPKVGSGGVRGLFTLPLIVGKG